MLLAFLQEIYWRIPPTMTPVQLGSAANSLRAPAEGEEDVEIEGCSEMGEEDGDGRGRSPESDSDDFSEEGAC